MIVTDTTILTQVSKVYEEEELTQAYKDIQQLKEEATKHPTGVGLAGIQIGIARRVFIVRDNTGEWLSFVNPVITKKSAGVCSMEEGCLSIPEFFKRIRRPKLVTVVYTDVVSPAGDFIIKEQVFSGFTSRIIQHEYDHLDGLLINQKKKK
jgi:peptide deformylase